MLHAVRILVAEILIALGTVLVGSLLESERAERIAYAVGFILALLVLIGLTIWERRRPKPDFERIERTVERDGRTETHWEEHRYGRTEARRGQARGSATGSGRATGFATKTYSAECTFSERYVVAHPR